ncbi:MAG TPA: hypothetical protein VN695_12635 [Streptosporangiaceae bacterium]|nr:hypothetical protein [Streptosporangiaceae bacterium]
MVAGFETADAGAVLVDGKDVGARRQGAAAAARADRGAAATARHHDPVRDPRSGGGAVDGRPGRRHEGRPVRAGRGSRSALRQAGDRVRGRISLAR